MTTSPRTLAALSIALLALAAGTAWLALGPRQRGGSGSAAPSGGVSPADAAPGQAATRAVATRRDEIQDDPQEVVAVAPGTPTVSPPPPAASPSLAIIGRLVNRGRNAMGGVSVHCHRVRMPLSGAGETIDSAESDPLGAFAFRAGARTHARLSYGDARVPLPRGDPVAVIEADVDLGDIELPALGSVEVEVLDDAGRPVPDAQVRASLEASNGIALATDAFGRATARHLPPGSYRFFASHSSAGRGNMPIDLAPGAHEKVKIELRTAP